jgi:hypothetical protein
MLEIRCDKCRSELHEPGALVFSPPTSQAWQVEKYHLCVDCWSEIERLLKQQKARLNTPDQLR